MARQGAGRKYWLVMAALVLAAPELPAKSYRSSVRPVPAPAAPTSSRPPATSSVAILVASPQESAPRPMYVDLRGPDGQIRRFRVEGGRAAIQSGQVVLRPGESLTILLRPAK